MCVPSANKMPFQLLIIVTSRWFMHDIENPCRTNLSWGKFGASLFSACDVAINNNIVASLSKESQSCQQTRISEVLVWLDSLSEHWMLNSYTIAFHDHCTTINE